MERLQGKAAGSTPKKPLDRGERICEEAEKEIFRKSLMNGFCRETSKEVICSCRERKKNPSAEGFRQVIAERDREIVEIRYKISLPAFFLKKARDLSKLRK